MRAPCFTRTTIRLLCGAAEPESREGDIETYVFEHLMPVKVEDSNNKHWYWMKYIACSGTVNL